MQLGIQDIRVILLVCNKISHHKLGEHPLVVSVLVLQACKSIQTIIYQHPSDYQVAVAVSLRAQGDHFPHVAHASVTGFASGRSANIVVEDRAVRYNRNMVAK